MITYSHATNIEAPRLRYCMKKASIDDGETRYHICALPRPRMFSIILTIKLIFVHAMWLVWQCRDIGVSVSASYWWGVSCIWLNEEFNLWVCRAGRAVPCRAVTWPFRVTSDHFRVSSFSHSYKNCSTVCLGVRYLSGELIFVSRDPCFFVIFGYLVLMFCCLVNEYLPFFQFHRRKLFIKIKTIQNVSCWKKPLVLTKKLNTLL